MLIYRRIPSSRANGPGNRAVIWTQGCTLKCPGCWNPDTHTFDVVKHVEVPELVDWVAGLPDIEGVTISGGEPFQQARGLQGFCRRLHQKRPDLSIGAYTGFTLDQLRQNQYNWYSIWTASWRPPEPGVAEDILAHMDFLVAGRFNRRLACADKPLCGSANQVVHFLTSRYGPQDLAPNKLEMIIGADGETIQYTGFPTAIEKLTE